MRKWVIAYALCVAFWVASDCALQYSDSFLFSRFMHIPLRTVIGLAGGDGHWFCLSHTSFAMVFITGNAALGFLPLVLAPYVKRDWPLWFTVAFVLAHPGLLMLILTISRGRHH